MNTAFDPTLHRIIIKFQIGIEVSLFSKLEYFNVVVLLDTDIIFGVLEQNLNSHFNIICDFILIFYLIIYFFNLNILKAIILSIFLKILFSKHNDCYF